MAVPVCLKYIGQKFSHLNTKIFSSSIPLWSNIFIVAVSDNIMYVCKN